MRRALSALAVAVGALLALLWVAGPASADDDSNIIDVGGVRVDLCVVAGDNQSILNFVNANNGDATDSVLTDVANALSGRSLADRRAHCGDRDRRGGAIVSNDGQCVTFRADRDRFRTSYEKLVARYNQLREQYLRSTSDGGTTITTAEQTRLNAVLAEANARRGDFNTTVGRLRTICKETTPTTVTLAPAPTSTVTAPAPQVIRVPSGAAETGDGSTATADYDGWLSSLGWAALALCAPLLGLLGWQVRAVRRR